MKVGPSIKLIYLHQSIAHTLSMGKKSKIQEKINARTLNLKSHNQKNLSMAQNLLNFAGQMILVSKIKLI